MSYQIKSRKAQPQYPVGLDRSKPAGMAITSCLPLNGSNREIITGAALSLGAAASSIVDSRGRALKSTGSAACASIPINLSSYTRVSVSFWMFWDAFANDDKLAMEYGVNFASSNGFLIDPNSSAPALGLIQAGVGSVGPMHNICSLARPTAAAWHHYIFNFDRDTGATASTSVYIDGISVSTTAITTSDVTNNFGNNTLHIFSRNNASLFGAGQMQNLVIRGGYLMSAAEAMHEYLNPWAIYAPVRRQSWLSSPAIIPPGGVGSNAFGSINSFGKKAFGANAFGS